MEKKHGNSLNLYGLIGKNISYSFSPSYFKEKFKREKLSGNSYVNFDIRQVGHLKDILKENPNLKGLNVTIPYKEVVIPLLDELNDDAAKIGAVNTIKISNHKLTGFNTDFYGFEKSLVPLLNKSHKKALILGTGGASKAIAYTLNKLNIPYSFVSRKVTEEGHFSYQDLNKNIIEEYTIIINCTPLGTFPKIEEKPDIPYQFVTSDHLFYDLIYNPSETTFLKLGKEKGAKTCNGLLMLQLQAEKAWEIWNS
ncbi:shikimate dehydrogenase [Flavobacteriaceae bacterium R38]|nr:shikimate dehydrogenase [Flavobacteriaceae bacterium R38]